MDVKLNAEQRQIRDFVNEEVVPIAAEIDQTDEIPDDLLDALADLGLMGMPFPDEYDRSGLDPHSYTLVLAEISRGSGGLGTLIAAHTNLAANILYVYGDEDQKTEYLAALNRGDDIGAFALSEANAGSDIPGMETTAHRDGDEYVVDGGKLWISNSSIADTITLFVKTDPDAGSVGISTSIVRPDEDDGFHVEGTEEKLGDHDCPTAELCFDKMRLPTDRLVGTEGDGCQQALKTLNAGRITIAAPMVSRSRRQRVTPPSTTPKSASSSGSQSQSSRRSSTSSPTWTRRWRVSASSCTAPPS